jgi:TPR repeat protein
MQSSDATFTDEIDLAFKNGDYSFVYQTIRPLAEAGDAKSQTRLGTLYALGRGVEQDFEESIKWFQLAAEQGYAQAQYAFGRQLSKGEGIAKDVKEAVVWFRKSADQNHPSSQHALGLAYELGEGIECNLEEAMKWYQLAADQGYSYTQYYLGWLYLEGRVIAKDIGKAISLLKMSAEQGNVEAQFELAVMYFEGNLMKQDFTEAKKWCGLAIDKEHPKAKQLMAFIYRDVGGIGRYKWLRGTLSERMIAFALSKYLPNFSDKKEEMIKRSSLKIAEVEVADKLHEIIEVSGNFLKVLGSFEKMERIIAYAITIVLYNKAVDGTKNFPTPDSGMTNNDIEHSITLSIEMEKPNNWDAAIEAFRNSYMFSSPSKAAAIAD